MPVDVSVLQDTPQMTAPEPVSCPGDCSEAGVCILGKCHCERGRTGPTARPWTRDSVKTTVTSGVFAAWVSAFVSLDTKENPGNDHTVSHEWS